jgi:hypothetical protein
MCQVVGSVHESDVREGLREIAQQPLSVRVILLGKQSDIVAKCQQPLEEALRLLAPVEQNPVVGEPEAAGEKYALPWWQPIAGNPAVVALHQPILREMTLDRLDGGAHPRIPRPQKAHKRQQQQAGIEVF